MTQVRKHREQDHVSVLTGTSSATTLLTLDVVSVSQSSELLLTSGVPTVEDDGTVVGVEVERVDFNTEGGCERWSYLHLQISLCSISEGSRRSRLTDVLLLELSRQVSLDKGGLSEVIRGKDMPEMPGES